MILMDTRPEIWGQIVGVQNCNGALKDKYHLMFRQEKISRPGQSGYQSGLKFKY